jgi:hypothetical protein
LIVEDSICVVKKTSSILALPGRADDGIELFRQLRSNLRILVAPWLALAEP